MKIFSQARFISACSKASVALVTAIVLTSAAQASSITYDLKSDFSNTANPNGVWSYTQGSTPLPHQAQPSDGNALNSAAANGYFGAGNTFTTAPFILQASENGAAASPYTNNDFLAGDILAHSTNPGSGSPLFIDWTAPQSGTITFSGDIWYAHSPVTRSNDFSLTLDGGSPLASGTVTPLQNRSNAVDFSSSGSLVVNAGDVLALELSPTAGQTFGSLAGVNLTVDFTTSTVSGVPEPASCLFVMGGLGLFGILFRRNVRRS